jgi:hypothetical protein
MLSRAEAVFSGDLTAITAWAPAPASGLEAEASVRAGYDGDAVRQVGDVVRGPGHGDGSSLVGDSVSVAFDGCRRGSAEQWAWPASKVSSAEIRVGGLREARRPGFE